jgi:hypothetical protein
LPIFGAAAAPFIPEVVRHGLVFEHFMNDFGGFSKAVRMAW